MKKLLVEIGMASPARDVSIKVSVRPEDRITFAVEVMLKNDLKQIAVTNGEKLLGVLRLTDALRILGLELNTRQERKNFVFYGKKLSGWKTDAIYDG
jgi:CBS domain-containing protein